MELTLETFVDGAWERAALWSWLMQLLARGGLGEVVLVTAIRYTFGHWEGLTVFLVRRSWMRSGHACSPRLRSFRRLG